MTLTLEVGNLCADVEPLLNMINIIVGRISRASKEIYLIFYVAAEQAMPTMRGEDGEAFRKRPRDQNQV